MDPPWCWKSGGEPNWKNKQFKHILMHKSTSLSGSISSNTQLKEFEKCPIIFLPVLVNF